MMMNGVQTTSDYTIAIIDPDTRFIRCRSDQRGRMLPKLAVDDSRRCAEALTQAIVDEFGLVTIQLALIPDSSGANYCSVHEVLEVRPGLAGGLIPCEIAEVSHTSLDLYQSSVISKIIAGDLTEFGRFARLGLIDEIARRFDFASIREVQHINSSHDFCLMRLCCDGRRLWLKAVGQPNTREYALTIELANLFPRYLAPVAHKIPEWHAWFAEEVVGTPLTQSSRTSDWTDSLGALAHLQQDAVPYVNVLSQTGAADWTSKRLLLLMDEFFHDAQTAMQAQTSKKIAPLSYRGLALLRLALESALEELARLGIPDTLVHGDIGHGNVICSEHGPIFLDWAESYIAHPFICSEHLIADLERSQGLSPQRIGWLRSEYAKHWGDYAGPRDLDRVSRIAPGLAAFFYGLVAWMVNRDDSSPARAWPLLRSMLRRSKREFEQL